MKNFLSVFSLFVACLILAGCGGKKSLTPEELKEELARSVPKEGFEPFKEISPGISVKSYSKKRPYDLFSPVTGEKSHEEAPAAAPSAVVPPQEREETSAPAEETIIAVAPKAVPDESVSEKAPVADKSSRYVPGIQLQPEQLAILDRWNGECLVYNITWNSIRFAKGMLACRETSNGYGDIFHVIGLSIPEPRAVKLGMGLYRMDAFIDKKSLLPHYYYQYSKNKNKEEILEIRFDWKKRFYRTKSRKFEDGKLYKTKEETVNIEREATYDGISIFYVVRTLDLDKHTSFTLPIAFKEIWDLTIRIAGRKTEDVPCIGKQEVYVLKPQAQNNEGFFTKGAMDLWITADNRRLPVYMEGKVPLGKARMSLMSELKLAPDVTFDSGTITEILSRFN